MNRKAEFVEHMRQICTRTRVETEYKPHGFEQLLGKPDAFDRIAARLTGPPPSGFLRLRDMERLDLSVEAVIVGDQRWSDLFTDEQLESARARLEEAEYFD